LKIINNQRGSRLALTLLCALSAFIVATTCLLTTPSPCYSQSESQRQSNRKPSGEKELEVDGRKRHYYFYVPEHQTSAPSPVILAFHGGGRATVPGGWSLDHYIDLSQKATKAGFIVVYPDGYKHSWNAGPGIDGKSPNWGPACEEKVDDVKFVKMLIDDLARTVPIDRHRIYATGMSNGSAMTYRLAVELCDQIAAAAGVVSELSLKAPVTIKRAVPVMYFWGTADPIERPGSPPAAERARRNIETWKRLNGCIGRPVVSTTGAAERQSFKGKAPVIVWTIKGSGHCWPGVDGGEAVNRVLGPPNFDVSASDEIIRFFNEHRLP
jgi:polyhydroxybutyrate depolymerase